MAKRSSSAPRIWPASDLGARPGRAGAASWCGRRWSVPTGGPGPQAPGPGEPQHEEGRAAGEARRPGRAIAGQEVPPGVAGSRPSGARAAPGSGLRPTSGRGPAEPAPPAWCMPTGGPAGRRCPARASGSTRGKGCRRARRCGRVIAGQEVPPGVAGSWPSGARAPPGSGPRPTSGRGPAEPVPHPGVGAAGLCPQEARGRRRPARASRSMKREGLQARPGGAGG